MRAIEICQFNGHRKSHKFNYRPCVVFMAFQHDDLRLGAPERRNLFIAFRYGHHCCVTPGLLSEDGTPPLG